MRDRARLQVRRAPWLAGALALVTHAMPAQHVTKGVFGSTVRHSAPPWVATPHEELPPAIGTGPPATAFQWTASLSADGETSRPRSAWAILASAVLPGAGQAMLRQWRAIPYLTLEGVALAQHRADSRSARRNRDAYRRLAATVARSGFGAFLPNGDFEYYERMESFLESGVFDAIPGGDVEPEQDTTTFNGAMWLLARRTFWKDSQVPPERNSPEWQRAQSFYAQRAVRPEFRWSWRGAPSELEQFRRYIRSSNERYRESVADVGVLIGNHLLSTVDSYVTVQLRRRSVSGARRVELSIQVPF